MTDVQLENGYTRIANQILEAMAKTKVSPIQYRIIFVVWRYTYGFQRKEHELSISFLSKAIGYDERNLQRALKSLQIKKIIRQRIISGCTRVVSFNKNIDEWVTESHGKTANGEIADGQIDDDTFGETDQGTIGKTDKQERNIKDNLKESIPYVEIIDYLNEVGGRSYRSSAPKTRSLISSRWKEGYRLEDFKRVIDNKTQEWIKDQTMAQYLRPETLFGTKFESYLNQPVLPNSTAVNAFASASAYSDEVPESVKRLQRRMQNARN